MNSYGNMLKLSLFGESHGPAVGCTVDGLPDGFAPDFDEIGMELSRRAPNVSAGSTARNEKDSYKIISGFYNHRTTGAPFTVVFANTDANSADYSDHFARPSHADLTAYVKYGGHNDSRGGGAFSGRMTVPIVFVGALIKQLLAEKGIRIVSHIYSIGNISDTPFDPVSGEVPQLDPFFPLVDPEKREAIEALFASLRNEGDSIGGMVECAVYGLPLGIGEPFFASVESEISGLLFSVPGVHGVEFGAGFAFSGMTGSEANDPIICCGKTATNHSGGVNGGITNGMPLIFRAAFRPVPSIAKEQTSIDYVTGECMKKAISGRHDVCILPRGCAVIEAAAAIALYDLILQAR